MDKILDLNTLKALKQCITGMTTEEITSEFVRDDESGKMIMVKQKKVEKNLPPNTDLIKLIYQKLSEKTIDYNKLSDEDLEKEKQRLLKQLKEKEDVSRKSKTKN